MEDDLNGNLEKINHSKAIQERYKIKEKKNITFEYEIKNSIGEFSLDKYYHFVVTLIIEEGIYFIIFFIIILNIFINFIIQDQLAIRNGYMNKYMSTDTN